MALALIDVANPDHKGSRRFDDFNALQFGTGRHLADHPQPGQHPAAFGIAKEKVTPHGRSKKGGRGLAPVVQGISNRDAPPVVVYAVLLDAKPQKRYTSTASIAVARMASGKDAVNHATGTIAMLPPTSIASTSRFVISSPWLKFVLLP